MQLRHNLLVCGVLAAGLFGAGPLAQRSAGDAADFMDRAEQRLLAAWIKAERAAWVQSNFITDDTESIAAAARTEMMAVTAKLAQEAAAFNDVEMPADLERKFRMLRTSQSLPAPADPSQQAELSELVSRMEGIYGKGKFCPDSGECLALGDMSRTFATSRDADELLTLWKGWRTVSPVMRPLYRRFAALANGGAEELGFDDLGQLWRSAYDMKPDAFAAEIDRLWDQVRPLYEKLHCHVRARLAEFYGEDVVALDEPIPAHLLGNMWAQSWLNIYDLVGPGSSDPGYDLTELLTSNGLDAREMVRYGERFFSSLGFAPLPDTFWERSLFTKPEDREVVCHASAWNIDYVDDLRIKMCIEVNDEDFVTIHHELGHNYYQRAYNGQSPLHRASANDGFHEGVGDTVALSITPEYLVKVGLLDEAPPASGDLGLLMKMALDKVAFLPFGVMIDQWRWKVFSGDIPVDAYNEGWWDLRERYQGLRPPVPRSESDFDPGAKYHVPANTPYNRYFLAHILQFQLHRSLCETAGFEGPLHRCSIYRNEAAGEKLIALLEMGASRPWQDALAAISGQREMDATAILDYFAPLERWLDAQNQDRTCGW